MLKILKKAALAVFDLNNKVEPEDTSVSDIDPIQITVMSKHVFDDLDLSEIEEGQIPNVGDLTDALQDLGMHEAIDELMLAFEESMADLWVAIDSSKAKEIQEKAVALEVLVLGHLERALKR
jgi:hypothetical protein